jgi:hypothetical protein
VSAAKQELRQRMPAARRRAPPGPPLHHSRTMRHPRSHRRDSSVRVGIPRTHQSLRVPAHSGRTRLRRGRRSARPSPRSRPTALQPHTTPTHHNRPGQTRTNRRHRRDGQTASIRHHLPKRNVSFKQLQPLPGQSIRPSRSPNRPAAVL